MTSFDYFKYEITEKILEEISQFSEKYVNCKAEDLMVRWWQTGRNLGLRLTDEGCTAFELANIEYHDIAYSLKEVINKNVGHYGFILELSKKLKCPYYLGLSTRDPKKLNIRLYDSRIAMVISLYGSISEYLSATKSRY